MVVPRSLEDIHFGSTRVKTVFEVFCQKPGAFEVDEKLNGSLQDFHAGVLGVETSWNHFIPGTWNMYQWLPVWVWGLKRTSIIFQKGLNFGSS